MKKESKRTLNLKIDRQTLRAIKSVNKNMQEIKKLLKSNATLLLETFKGSLDIVD